MQLDADFKTFPLTTHMLTLVLKFCFLYFKLINNPNFVGCVTVGKTRHLSYRHLLFMTVYYNNGLRKDHTTVMPFKQ